MDSLSQFALGAGVGVAVMGRRTRVWKAALWGGLWGTVPDLARELKPEANFTLEQPSVCRCVYVSARV